MSTVQQSEIDLTSRINNLFARCQWAEAREILEQVRERNPHSHWVLTQLGVTFYEERKYEEALKILLESLKVVGDCPLTLWNLAGVLDSLGNHHAALRIYIWLLRSKKTPKEDSCWESREWTDALKTDCVYRSGVCFKHMGKKQQAEHCFRQYVNILLTGIKGTYSLDDVMREIEGLYPSRASTIRRSELREAFQSTLQQSGIELTSRNTAPPQFSERELLAGRRSASKK